MSMESEEQLLRQRSLLNRQVYQHKAIAQNELPENQPTQYLGVDGNTGLSILKNFTGSYAYGRSLTNGAVGRGDVVRMRGDKYDGMPRIKSTENSEVSIQETYKFVALAATKVLIHDLVDLSSSNNYRSRIFVGVEPQIISVDCRGFTGSRVEITYPGGSFTSSTLISGQTIYETFSYTPEPDADGYIECVSPTNQQVNIQLIYQIFFYIFNKQKIIKLPYQVSNQLAYLNLISILSYTKDKIYITFKEPGFYVYEKITIITLNRGFEVESVEIFDYEGVANLSLPNNKDWRSSFTHSFSFTPTPDSIACVNTFRANIFVHIDVKKSFISKYSNSANLIGKSTPVEFEKGKFTVSGNTCSAIYQPKKVSTKFNSLVSNTMQNCDTKGIAIYV